MCARWKKIKLEKERKKIIMWMFSLLFCLFFISHVFPISLPQNIASIVSVSLALTLLSLSLFRTVYNRHASVVIADFPPRLLLFPLAIFPSPSQATSAALHATRGPRMHSCQSYLHNRPDWTVSCRDRGLCKSWLGSQPATHPPAV